MIGLINDCQVTSSGQTFNHAMIGLINVCSKDANHVNIFATTEERNLKPVKIVNQFTDGYASQHKGRNAFHDI